MSALRALRSAQPIERHLAEPELHRYRDPEFGATVVKVLPGRHYVTDNREEMLVTVLGSCVAACIRDPAVGVVRLVEGDASLSVAALCVTRSADGRWLAGRRAPWLSSWPGRWALGAGGAVDVGESPVDTLTRELDEEWSVAPERVQVEALVRLPHRLVMLVGQAWLPEGAEVTPDHEHDDYAWWPADDRTTGRAEADEPLLRRMAAMLADRP